MHEALDVRTYRHEFIGFCFSEARLELTRDGEPVELDRQSRLGLQVFLARAGEVVTREELLEQVWGTQYRSEGSVTNLIYMLRKVLGNEAIATVHRVGYRFTPQVVRSAEAPSTQTLAFKAGQSLPQRPHWQLASPLVGGQHPDVWLVEHVKTGERRVFKFAVDAAGLRRLKREVTLARLIHSDAANPRPGFVRILDWCFDDVPFHIEMAWEGEDLERFAERGGLAAYDRGRRLGAFIRLAEGVAAAHALGFIHKDLKPRNLLVKEEAGEFSLAIGDFGSGALASPSVLDDMSITRLGLTDIGGTTASAGTPIWRAPELLGGASPTLQVDVYSLGVILFQLLTGDVRHPLTEGWVERIDDPLLVEDIAAAAHGSPERRLATATDLVKRLKSLDSRRDERKAQAAAAVEAANLRRAFEQSRARRPWQWAAASALAVGMVISLVLAWQRQNALDDAVKATKRSEIVQEILTKDLLGQIDPDANPTLGAALVSLFERARPQVLEKAADDPLLLGALHMQLARLYVLLSRPDLASRDIEAAARFPADTETERFERDGGLLMVLAYQGPSERGKQLAEQLIAAREHGKTLSPAVINGLGTYLYVSGETLRARQLFEETFGGLTAEQVGASLDDQMALSNWARAALLDPRDLDMAERAMAPLFAALDAGLIARPVSQVHILDQRGLLAQYRGDSERAVEMLLRAREIADKHLPPRHHARGMVIGDFGKNRYEAGSLKEARDAFLERLESDREVFPPHAPSRVVTTLYAAEVACRLGKFDEAHRLLDEVEKPTRENKPSPNLVEAVTLVRVLTLLKSGAVSEARSTMNGTPPSDAQDGYANLVKTRRGWVAAQLYAAEGKPDEARRMAVATLEKVPRDQWMNSLITRDLMDLSRAG